jgi:hypothetical protein
MDCQSYAKPSEKDHDLPGIRTRTFGLAVSIANHYTIKVVIPAKIQIGFFSGTSDFLDNLQ